jgi:signal transduction histidine kinase
MVPDDHGAVVSQRARLKGLKRAGAAFRRGPVQASTIAAPLAVRPESGQAEALERALAAETEQRARADELAAVLRASEGLVLLGEGKIDFMGMLSSITPPGATSYLASIEAGESVVAAAHGPLAPWCIGLHEPPNPALSASKPIAYYSAGGRTVPGATEMPRGPQIDAGVRASLSIRFGDHGGETLGWLALLDPAGERILEPSFVTMAQLVANQIGVAIENRALLARVQNQLVEMQRVQQQLVQVARLGAIGELSAAVAHEVNNPLTGILGFSELLIAEMPEDDPRRPEVAVIQSEAVRARSIVRSLLEFARPRPPQRVRTDLNELLHATLDLTRYRAEAASVWVSEDYGELQPIDLDPEAIKQVVLNLVSNAIEAMPHGGELRTTTRLVDDRVRITVGDSGIGMDAQTRERVFSPFFTTRAGLAGGTGLGLSVSLQIVETHGGSIEVSSKPGRGTEFTVWLPAAWEAFEGRVLVAGGEAQEAGSGTNNEAGDGNRTGPGRHQGRGAAA